MEAYFALPLADILVLGVVVFFAIRGLMRGALRELFSFLRFYFSFIAAAILYRTLSSYLYENTEISLWLLHIITFSFIFFVLLFIIWLIEALISRWVTKPETRSGLSRIGGAIFGLAEGILVVSAIIMVINFHS